MASLETNTIAATYVGLLKTADNAVRGAEGSADQCSDGAGNTIPLYVSATEVYAVGSGTGTSHTAFGKNCGVDLAAGTGNSLFGEGAGADVTTGEHNVAVGYHALYQGTTETDDNVAIGYNAMSGSWTTAAVNDCVVIGSGAGAGALVAAASGAVAVGTSALAALTSGSGNVAVGAFALDACTDSNNNTAVGHQALTAMTGSAGITANVAVGFQAGTAITKGRYNTAIGYHALPTDDVGDASTAVGYHALYSQNSDSDNEVTANVGMGHSAGFYNVTGQNNTSLGYHSGMGTSTKSHSGCVFIGSKAGERAYTGNNNIAIGYGAMKDVDADATVGAAEENIFIGKDSGGGTWETAASNHNVAVGNDTMDAAMNGANNNTAVGHGALSAVTTGDDIVAIGYQAGDAITTTSGHVAIGSGALSASDDGDYNVAIGYHSMVQASGNSLSYNVSVGAYSMDGSNTGAESNTAIGYGTLSANMTDGADFNTAIGKDSLAIVTTGSHNTCVGYDSGDVITTGYSNTIIGASSDPSALDAINQTVLGYGVTAPAVNNAVTLGNADVTAVYMSQDATSGTGADVHAKQFHGYALSAQNSEMQLKTYTDTASNFSIIRLQKSNQDTVGHTATADDDYLGGIIFAGNSGSAFVTSVQIQSRQDGSVSGSNVPGDFDIWTNNGSAFASRFLIAADGTFTGSGSADISDEELKENIKDVENGLDTINKLQGRTFTWKETAGMQTGTKYGLIAQELEKVLPDLVYDKTGIREKEDGTYYKSIQMSGVIPVLIEAVKELSAKVEALENK